MLHNTLLEIIGFVAAIMICIAGVLSKSVINRKLRIELNAVGSFLFILYGIHIRSLVVVFVSVILTVLRLYLVIRGPEIRKGCVIIGYQGIGKSTLSTLDFKYVDLESSSFYVNGDRDPGWYQIYCEMAVRLSEQGYRVFVSSHMVVREYLISMYSNSGVDIFACYPSLSLENDWIERLRLRYESTNSDKDRRAYLNALDQFSENIHDIKTCGAHRIELTSMNYNLDFEVTKAINDLNMERKDSSKNF